MKKGGATTARMASKHRIGGNPISSKDCKPMKLAAGGSAKVRLKEATKAGKPMKAKGMCS